LTAGFFQGKAALLTGYSATVSEKSIEIVRQAIEAWNRQDYDAVLKLVSPQAELDASGRVLNPDTYVGAEGFVRFRDEIAEAWERFQLEIEQLFDAEAQVVVFVRSIGTGRGSGVEVDFRSAWLVEVSGGKITRGRLYRDRSEALEAAGLSD
jgi:ketosteroid isomerase-like protein